jgi:hypothetical protein
MSKHLEILEKVRENLMNDIAFAIDELDVTIEDYTIRQAKAKTLTEKLALMESVKFMREKRSVLRHTLFGMEDLVNDYIDKKIAEYHEGKIPDRETVCV